MNHRNPPADYYQQYMKNEVLLSALTHEERGNIVHRTRVMRNTMEVHLRDTTRLWIHYRTVIFRHDPYDNIVLDTGGYFTYSTRIRLHRVMSEAPYHIGFWQQWWQWYIHFRIGLKEPKAYEDEMYSDPDKYVYAQLIWPSGRDSINLSDYIPYWKARRDAKLREGLGKDLTEQRSLLLSA